MPSSTRTSSCKSDRDTEFPGSETGKMWIKNLSNNINTFNKSKLYRLDSTGEVSSEVQNTDYLPSVNLITSESVRQQGVTRCNFPIKPLTLVSGIKSSCQEFLHNLSNKSNSGYCSPLTDFTNLDSSNSNMYSDKFNRCRVPWSTHLWNPYFGHPNKWMPFRNNFVYNSEKAFCTPSQNTLKLPFDSPWLQVNSGYFNSPNKGSNGYCYSFRPKVPHNNKSKHKTVRNPKNKQEGKRGSSEKVSSAINGDHNSIRYMGSEVDIQKAAVNVEDICVNAVSEQSVCETESKPCSPKLFHGRDTSKKLAESKVFNSINVSISQSVGESNTSSSAKLANTARSGESIPHPVFNANSPCDSVPPTPYKVNIQVNSNNPSQHSRPISQVYLSIIGKKNQNKQRIPAHQETNATPDSKMEGDDKISQKNCSICSAYITRVTPKCTDFPKSAGCKHSIILLVRDNTKKTKKRRTKEKASMCQSSPKSFIVGVNSSQNPDNSHVFRFIASDTSDTDDSWDSCDEDEVDGDVTDWSNIEMDDVFPENNLLNPMNFKVHITSYPQTSAKDPSNQTENYIKTINLSWNIQILDTNKSSPCSVTKKTKHKQVHFANDNKMTVVHPIIAWSYAYRASRKGPWEEFARDRERFRRRIADIDNALSQILTESHRSQIYNSLHCGVAINK